MNIPLKSIQMDTGIQCRASIAMGTVNEYADRMTEGDEFPPVVLFGTKERCWIGDGWHRVMAAQQCDFIDIPADLRKGDRKDALRFALSANAVHGHRRTNEDKRRCVELAIAEWPKLTHQQIADMCAVSVVTVKNYRDQLLKFKSCPQPTTRVGRDGKTYPTKYNTNPDPEPEEELPDEEPLEEELPDEEPVLGPPCDGLQFADIAILNLEQIKPDDLERKEAFEHVRAWIDAHENGGVS